MEYYYYFVFCLHFLNVFMLFSFMYVHYNSFMSISIQLSYSYLLTINKKFKSREFSSLILELLLFYNLCKILLRSNLHGVGLD